MAMMTASIPLPISSSILRKSWNAFGGAPARKWTGGGGGRHVSSGASAKWPASFQRRKHFSIFCWLTSQMATMVSIFGIVSTNHSPRPPTPTRATFSLSLAA